MYFWLENFEHRKMDRSHWLEADKDHLERNN